MPNNITKVLTCNEVLYIQTPYMHEHVIVEGTTSSYTSDIHRMLELYSTYHGEKDPSLCGNLGRDIVQSRTVMHVLVGLTSFEAVQYIK